MSCFAVLHAADLHLDAPFEGIGRTPAHIAAALRDASLAAWDGLVELAIARDVAAVLLAGGPEGVDALPYAPLNGARHRGRVLVASPDGGTFARQQQVLFFTCHPSTRDLLQQHGAAARVVEL